MILIEEAIQIHALLIQKFGGTTGVRDREALYSALTRPYQMFGAVNFIPLEKKKQQLYLKA